MDISWYNIGMWTKSEKSLYTVMRMTLTKNRWRGPFVAPFVALREKEIQKQDFPGIEPSTSCLQGDSFTSMQHEDIYFNS